MGAGTEGKASEVRVVPADILYLVWLRPTEDRTCLGP